MIQLNETALVVIRFEELLENDGNPIQGEQRDAFLLIQSLLCRWKTIDDQDLNVLRSFLPKAKEWVGVPSTLLKTVVEANNLAMSGKVPGVPTEYLELVQELLIGIYQEQRQ
jgi:hypothetical protein